MFSSFEHPYIVVNEFFEIQETHGDLRQFLSFPSGTVSLNLLNLIHPTLQIELRAILTRSVKNNQAAASAIRPLTIGRENLLIRLNVKPLTYKRDQQSLYLVIIEKIKFDEHLKLKTSDSSVEISSDAYRELESELAHTKESLQSYIEEIETSNEELQALNEELQSLNEEMQSTNEELETSNEELQSTTEEARIAYAELQIAHKELAQNEERIKESEARAEALLNNNLQAFILIDKEQNVLKFNAQAREIFKLLYNAKIALGDNLREYLPENQKNYFLQNIQETLSGKPYAGEQKIKAINDKEYWMRFHLAPVFSEENEVTTVSVGILDITELKKTASRLNYTEKLVNSVFDSTNFGLCITDEKGNYVDVNHAYCKIYGYDRKELLGQPFTAVAPPAQKAQLKQLHDDLIDGKNEQPFEAEQVNKKGELIWVSVSAQRLVRENGQVFKIISVQDITRRKVLEAQRDALREGLPGVTWQYRLFPNHQERLLSVSEGAQKMWGLSPEEAMHDVSRVWAVIHEEDREELREKVMASGENLITLQAEFRVKIGDKIAWHRVHGNPVKLHYGSIMWNCLALDITAEKTSLDSLKESERKLSQAVEIASIGYWEIDASQEPHVLKWSKEHYKIWEWEPGQPDPNITNFLTTVHEGDYDSFLAAYQKMIEQKVPFDKQYRILVNGKTKWIHAKGLPDKEKPRHYSGTAQDITKEKLIFTELEESERKLSQAVDIANIGYWEMNLKTKALSWSPHVFEILELDPKKFYPHLTSLLDVVHKDDLAKVEKAIAQTQEEGLPYDIEYRIETGEKTKWIHAKGLISNKKSAEFKGTVVDITARKEEESRLKLLESVVTNTGDPVMITTTQETQKSDVRILFVNEAFTEMTGYSFEEVKGKSPKLLQGPNSNFAELRKMKQSMLKWQPFETTTINYKKDGTEFWNKFRVYPIENDKGEYTHWVSIDQNVTAYKQRQRQYNVLNQISLLFNDLEHLQDVLEAITRKLVKEEEQFEVAEIWLADHRTERFDLRAFAYSHEKYKPFHGKKNERSLKRNIGLTGLVWQNKKPFLARNLSENENYYRKEAAKRAGIQTAYALPLLHAGEVVGVLLLGTVKDLTNSAPFELLFDNFTRVLGTEILRKKLEEDITTIYNTVPDVISVSDFEGNIIDINKTGAELLGYTPEKLHLMNWDELLYPDDIKSAVHQRQMHKKGIATPYYESRYRTQNGTIIWLAWTIKPDLNRKVTFEVGKDITQEKELQLMLDNANRIAKMGAWTYHHQKDEVFYSSMARKINESPAEWKPENLDDKIKYYVKSQNRERLKSIFKNAIENLQGFDVEMLKYTYNRKNKIWVRLIGEPAKTEDGDVLINGTIQDISQRKNAELMAFKTLEEKEEILESIGDGFYSIDQNYRVSYWNNKSTELLGVAKSEIIGKCLWDFFPDAKNSELYTRYQRALQTNEEQKFTFYNAPQKTYYDVSVFPAKGIGLSVYFKDMTERVRYIKAIEDRNNRLSKIAWTQSHVVRAPLARIMGLVNLMEDGLIAEEEVKDTLKKIMDSSKELDEVIRKIVNLSRNTEIQ